MIEYVGRQLGNYVLLHPLGHGGFAHVYVGEHVYLNTRAAIKVLQIEVVDERHNDFLYEAQTLAQMVHPNIVRILDFGVEDNLPFLVMDYIPNGSLRQLNPKGTRLPLETIVSYVKQVASALQYAHAQNVVHRDVKPGNMLLGEHNEVLLSDFGLATVAYGSDSPSSEETVLGTALYMAPEQIYGKPHPASDQYALATVVYEWLCGKPPFHGSFVEVITQQMAAPPPALSTYGVEVSAKVEEVIMIGLSKDYKDRFKSIEAFALALELASKPDMETTAQLKTEHQPILLHPQTLPIISPPTDL